MKIPLSHEPLLIMPIGYKGLEKETKGSSLFCRIEFTELEHIEIFLDGGKRNI
jgi:hypothetical protein